MEERVLETPRPTAAHLRLERLAGVWTGEDRLHPSPWDPEGGTADSRSLHTVALGGFWLQLDCRQERDGEVSFEGRGLLGWDEATSEYVLHWFDSMCATRSESRGSFVGDTLELKGSLPEGQGELRLVYELRADGRLGFRMELSPDGSGWQPCLEGLYTRSA